MRITMSLLAAAALIVMARGAHAQAHAHVNEPAHAPSGVRVDVNAAISALVDEEDVDGDRKITIADCGGPHTTRGDKKFLLRSVDGRRLEVSGTYYLSNLLQELTLARERGEDTADIAADRIFEAPTLHLSRIIRDVCWSGLTRRMDAGGLHAILADEKMTARGGLTYVYVPEEDTAAVGYYRGVVSGKAFDTVRLMTVPPVMTEKFLHTLDGRHGILSLALAAGAGGESTPVPFVVPGGRFNELYGWDSYFITLGLIADRKFEMARSMVDQHVYEIMRYGKILNANRTYYLTRSQPPFLTSMARAVYETMEKNDVSRAWLRSVLIAAIREHAAVWMGPDRLTRTGLSRYFDTGTGPCPEVEAGHYDDVFANFARRHRMTPREFEQAYRRGAVKDRELDDYFLHDRAMRESGHDTSYRLVGRAANLATVDLNALLYKIETDIAELLRDEFSGALSIGEGKTVRSTEYAAMAVKRKVLVNTYLWDADSGIYYDYDAVKRARTGYLSAASLYPLWAGLASPEQAASLVARALPVLELPGGIASSSEASRGAVSAERKERQWDFPNGWPPHQMLAWEGLRRYGYDSIAMRLAYRWLYTMTINAVNYNGTITEKLNVEARTHDVFAEYGNVGTKFSYITREGFGWSNASYQVGLPLLTPSMREALDRLVPPEWLFTP